jgi:hypothetical protein
MIGHDRMGRQEFLVAILEMSVKYYSSGVLVIIALSRSEIKTQVMLTS